MPLTDKELERRLNLVKKAQKSRAEKTLEKVRKENKGYELTPEAKKEKTLQEIKILEDKIKRRKKAMKYIMKTVLFREGLSGSTK
jgi:hypothetical protein